MPVCMTQHRAVYYQPSGQPPAGASLLFIHGSGASQESWQEQMNDLPSGILGVAIDLPGHGLTPGPAMDRVPELAEMVIDLLKHLDLPRPLILVGHSLGAAIALQTAGMEGDLIDGLVLLGGGAKMRVLPAFLNGLAAGLIDLGFFRLAFAPQAAPTLVETQLQLYAKVPAQCFFRDLTACNEFDVTDQLPLIQQPVLLLVGDQDRLTPPKNSVALREKLTQAELVIIPDAGHFAMLEKPGPVNQAIHDFIRKFINIQIQPSLKALFCIDKPEC